MRQNAFGECYCHTVSEAVDTMAKLEIVDDEVYVSSLIEEPDDIHEMWIGSVLENIDGEAAFYLEGPTKQSVLDMIKELEISYDGT